MLLQHGFLESTIRSASSSSSSFSSFVDKPQGGFPAVAPVGGEEQVAETRSSVLYSSLSTHVCPGGAGNVDAVAVWFWMAALAHRCAAVCDSTGVFPPKEVDISFLLFP